MKRMIEKILTSKLWNVNPPVQEYMNALAALTHLTSVAGYAENPLYKVPPKEVIECGDDVVCQALFLLFFAAFRTDEDGSVGFESEATWGIFKGLVETMGFTLQDISDAGSEINKLLIDYPGDIEA